MALGLTSAQIKEILDKDILEDLIEKYEGKYEGCPHLTGAFGLRELIIKLIIENNTCIESQLSSAGVILS